MGLFNFLFGNNKENKGSVFAVVKEVDYYTPKYVKILKSRPNIFDIYGRDYDFPKYNDRFKTDEGYFLRELLLLVWWGKTKSGRKSTVTIPKYFFSQYNLNAEKLTREFKAKGFIFDDGERTLLTDEGRIIVNKYLSLWEIHSTKEYPTNLDIDFPSWNKDKFDLMFYQMQNKYYNENAKFCKKMVDYLNSFDAPASAKEIHNEINYYINEGNSSLARAVEFKEKASILEEKINETSQLDLQ